MKTALLFLLMAASLEWGWAPTYKLLQQSKLVVAGEVVEIKKDVKGRQVARLRVDLVLKGKPESDVIDLPFKTSHTWGCDFTIGYEKGKKYLLLLDDRADFRVVYYPAGTHDEILALDGPQVSYVRLLLDVMNGNNLAQRVPELLKKAGDSSPEAVWSRKDALHAFRSLPRSAVRPYLADIRAAVPKEDWKKLEDARSQWHYYSCTFLSADVEVIRDLSYVSDLLAVSSLLKDSLPETLSLVTGWPVGDLEAFKGAWKAALRRAEAHGDAAAAKKLLTRLGSQEPKERDQAYQAILDLGPDVIDAVQAAGGTEDLETRARIENLVRELRFLQDLRTDLAARKR